VGYSAGHSNVTITSGYLHVAVEEDGVGCCSDILLSKSLVTIKMARRRTFRMSRQLSGRHFASNFNLDENANDL
jgi:hypothetical protein